MREGNQNVRRGFASFSGADCRAGDRDRRSIGRQYADAAPLTGAKAHPLVEASVTERDAYYSAQRSRTREALPRVIFIPGILGSVIRECGADDTGCKDIWGTEEAFFGQNDLTWRDNKIYHYDFVRRVFFVNVYGKIVEHLDSLAHRHEEDKDKDILLRTFPYDWRVSNLVSAERLAKVICEERVAAPKSPIYILAHSMGGLVAKIWVARFAKTPCENGTAPDVSEIAFVATPHLGAPKTIQTFVEGYAAFFEDLGYISNLFKFYQTNYVFDFLNSAGYSYPSLYELLPIRSSPYCRTKYPPKQKLAEMVDDQVSAVNVFDREVWKKFDLLSRIKNTAAKRYSTKNNWVTD
jgi:Lecithin:cholesterol acyltransferase